MAILAPKHGDIVGYCDHRGDLAVLFKQAVTDRACDIPDCPHETDWIMCCHDCAEASPVPLAGHGAWEGSDE